MEAPRGEGVRRRGGGIEVAAAKHGRKREIGEERKP